MFSSLSNLSPMIINRTLKTSFCLRLAHLGVFFGLMICKWSKFPWRFYWTGIIPKARNLSPLSILVCFLMACFWVLRYFRVLWLKLILIWLFLWWLIPLIRLISFRHDIVWILLLARCMLIDFLILLNFRGYTLITHFFIWCFSLSTLSQLVL